MKALRFLRKHFKRNNVRAFDRGFDTNKFFEDLIKHKEKFVIRVSADRNVIYKGETTKMAELAKKYKGGVSGLRSRGEKERRAENGETQIMIL